jgi:hypothetical protein
MRSLLNFLFLRLMGPGDKQHTENLAHTHSVAFKGLEENKIYSM